MSKKKLSLSSNKMTAGVLAGVAEYFDHDPTLWRLGFVLFLAVTGLMPGVLIYAVAYVLMPEAEIAPDVTYRVVED